MAKFKSETAPKASVYLENFWIKILKMKCTTLKIR